MATILGLCREKRTIIPLNNTPLMYGKRNAGRKVIKRLGTIPGTAS
jgi:hypothetical protein